MTFKHKPKTESSQTHTHHDSAVVDLDHAHAMHSHLFINHHNCNSHHHPDLILNTKKKKQMLPHHSLPILLLLLFISTPPPAAALNTVADCGPSLLPLSPCAPFVQGSTPAPVRTCCDSVEKLYKHNVTCLCVLLDNSGPELPLPINTTLALQLPLLCKLNISPTTCPGTFTLI